MSPAPPEESSTIDRGRSPRPLTFSARFFLITCLILLWPVTQIFLSPDRGIEPSDEGLAFLFAEHPERPTGGLPAFGWVTRPLWILAAGDVASFRTAAAWLMLTVSSLVGVAAVGLIRGDSSHGSTGPSVLDSALGFLIGTSGGVLFYATGLTRTPSYDWVNVFALTVAVLGILLVVRSVSRTYPIGRVSGSVRFVTGSSMMGIGALLTLGGRPTSGPLVIAAGLLVITVLQGARSAVLAGSIASVAAACLTFTAILAKIWPTDVLVRMLEPVLTITGRDDGSILRAFSDLARLPLDLIVAAPSVLLITLAPFALRMRPSVRLRQLLFTAAVLVLILWGALEALGPLTITALHAGDGPPVLVSALGGRTDFSADFYIDLARAMWRRWGIVLSVGLSVSAWIVGSYDRRRESVSASLVAAGTVVGTTPVPPFGSERLGSALVLIAAGLALSVGPGPAIGTGDITAQGNDRRILALPAGVLFVVALVSGFGSFAGPAWQFSRTATIVAAAAILLIGMRPRPQQRPSLVVLVTALAVLSAYQIEGARSHPYRSRPISEQVLVASVGPANSRLLLDEEMTRLLQSLSASSVDAGWSRGTRLWEVPIRSTPLLAWHLDAELASNFALWWGDTRRLDETFSRIDASEWADAWLLTSGTTLEDPSDLERRGQVVEAVTTRLGTTFPDDYERVWWFSSDRRWLNLELWRPRSADRVN